MLYYYVQKKKMQLAYPMIKKFWTIHCFRINIHHIIVVPIVRLEVLTDYMIDVALLSLLLVCMGSFCFPLCSC
jgi:hypothetical protein